MASLVDWLFNLISQIISIITGNWFLLVLIGIFLIGVLVPIVFKLFKK